MLLLFFQSNSDFGTFTCCILPIVFLIFIIVMGVAHAKEQKVKEDSQKQRRNKKLEELKPAARTSVGKYLAGLPNVGQSAFEIDCVVVGDQFLFLDGIGRELDKIPRDSINQIIVDDKSQITQRLTVPRLLALGVFAFAAPLAQKHKTFCLVIDWDDEKGVRQNTLFEFEGESSAAQANAAANVLKRHTKPKVERLQSSEKKCPFCAEIIKREAKICRFCRSELPEEMEGNTIDESADIAEEQISFDVVLQSFGRNKINAIKVMMELKGFGLADAKNFVESAPATISHSVSRAEAEEIKRRLEDVGAIVEIK